MRISDWSSDVCSSDLLVHPHMGSEQRQIIKPCRQPAAGLTPGLQPLQYLAGAGDHRRRQAGELRHRKPVAAIGSALRQLMQKNEVALPFPRTHMMEGKRIQPARQPRQFVIMGRSEEHTSELQSLMRITLAVFWLKKKK